jgi:hypothetical protein
MADPSDERMDERMDGRLASAALRWQAEQRPPPTVPLDRLDAALPRRPVPWRRLTAVAAALLVVAGGAAVLAGRGGAPAPPPSPSTPPEGTEQPAARVPWQALPAGHPHLRHTVRGRIVTPYDHVAVTGDISGVVHPGQVLTFTAVLESPKDLPLLPCPDYTVTVGTVAVTRQLNCARVPYFASVLKADGTMGAFSALIPLNTRVGFLMRVRVPDVIGDQKVRWTLDGPHEEPGFEGIVHVTPG